MKPSSLTALVLCAALGSLVQSSALQAQTPLSQSLRNNIRVQLTPLQFTELSTEIAGRIARIAVKEGESFSQGQVLLAMDCSLHQARLDKALAQSREATKVLDVNQQLDRLGSISVLEVEIAHARLAAAEADVSLTRAIVERCEIKAPFSGKVASIDVNAYQFVAEGQLLLSIVDDSSLNVEMMVPSQWLPRLQIGSDFQLQIDETGSAYPARLDRLGAVVDAVSQSVKIYGSIHGQFPELAAGMSGTASLAISQTADSN